MADKLYQNSSPPQKPQEAPPGGLLGLAAVGAVVPTLALLVAVFSPGTSTVNLPADALPLTVVSLAAVLLLVYPLWPGTLLGRGDPVNRFWPWLPVRLAEVALLLAVALPAILVAAVLSGVPLWRIGEVLIGLIGTASAAVTYRFVHQAGSPRLRALAIPDLMIFLFGPLVAGYLVLESSGHSIGWLWLISPLALARSLAVDGLAVGGANFYVGLVGYTAVSAGVLLLVRWLVRRYRDQHTPHRATR
ncbi:MAG: hypothetical protein GWP05_04930 [Anaerolineaceae bacterium]|nr:hypothetical protein [Anaerolineaceae bacterium]